MKRWHLRVVLAYTLVFGASGLYLFWDRLGIVWRYGIPISWLVFAFFFGWYDLLKPKSQNDPLVKTKPLNKRRLKRILRVLYGRPK
jgi:hypothetical protein